MKHVVTGGTGFIGSSLIVEILDSSTSNQVVATSRNKKGKKFKERLFSAVEQALEGYEMLDKKNDFFRRIKVFQIDSKENLHNEEFQKEIENADIFWNSAADLRYDWRKIEDIRKTNVEGTMNFYSLANQSKIKRFIQISTAYVAGNTSGEIFENASIDPENAINAYEKTKAEAELKLISNKRNTEIVILRPAIVIGHSKTGWTPNRNGVYGVVDAIKKISGIPGMNLSDCDIICEPEAPSNLINVDKVTKSFYQLGVKGRSDEIYHVVSYQNTNIGKALDIICSVHSDKKLNQIKEKKTNMNIPSKLIEKNMRFQKNYIANAKTFNMKNSLSVIEKELLGKIEEEDIKKMSR